MKMSKNSRVASAIAFSMLLFALPAMLSAQDVAAWFSKTANKTAYGSIAGEVDALAAALRGGRSFRFAAFTAARGGRAETGSGSHNVVHSQGRR